MKILILGNLNTIFTFEYVKEVLLKNNFKNISVLTSETKEKTHKHVIEYCRNNGVNVFYKKSSNKKIKKRRFHPFLILSNVFRYKIVKKFDIIHVHGVTPITPFIGFFASRKSIIILSYYGSDLLRTSNKVLKFQKYILKKAKHITLATHAMIDEFNKTYKYKYKDKVVKAMYGTTQVDFFKQHRVVEDKKYYKEKFNFPNNKYTVYIGYNGFRAQNHLDIISNLSNLEDDIKSKIHLVCHCSYGLDKEYKDEILSYLYNSNITFDFITDYLQKEQLVYFRMACDIFINMQISDALSASMIESLDGGAVVIKADWLIYKEIEDYEGFLFSIPNFFHLGNKIAIIVNDFPKYKMKAAYNKGILEYLLSWDNHSKIWLKLY